MHLNYAPRQLLTQLNIPAPKKFSQILHRLGDGAGNNAPAARRNLYEIAAFNSRRSCICTYEKNVKNMPMCQLPMKEPGIMIRLVSGKSAIGLSATDHATAKDISTPRNFLQEFYFGILAGYHLLPRPF